MANPPKFPVRVVLNNRTLSIFASTVIQNIYIIISKWIQYINHLIFDI
jgi:hypothetical protein